MSAERSILARVLANAGTLLGGRTVNAVVSLGYIALTARGLSPAQMGVLVLINAFAQFLGDVVKFQSWQTVLQYGAGPLLEGDRPRFQQVVRLSLFLDLVSGLAGVTLGVGGAFLLGPVLGWSSQVAPIAALYALTIFVMTSATSVGLLRLFDKFRYLAGEQAISSTVRLIGAAIALSTHAPLWAFLLAWALGPLVSFLYVGIVAWREMGRRNLLEGFRLRGALSEGLPGVWKFAWATNFSSSLDVAFTHVITLMVGALLGPTQAALWRIGRQVADGMAKPARLVIPALYPELAKMRAMGGDAAMRKLAGQIALLGGAVAGVLLLITTLFGKPLLILVMGKAYESAAGVMTWQVAAAAIGVLALPLEPMLVSMRAPGDALRVRMVVCAVFLLALT
ncbi:MAG TPA: lipopolysaccharide biosynthesis protein, partial [Caulobacter sp.]